MLNFLRISKADLKILLAALVITVLIFSVLYYKYVHATGTSLTVTVGESLDFSIPVTDVFDALSPGTYRTATSTLQVITNSADGYNITLYGDDQGLSNTVMDLTTDASVGITDQTEWIAPTATTTVGNSVLMANLDSTGDVLAFRVMSTSTAAFYSSTWWGANDTVGTALWAGIASSTDVSKIGNRNDYSSPTQLHTVVYYLDVTSGQRSGSYSGNLTFSITGTP